MRFVIISLSFATRLFIFAVTVFVLTAVIWAQDVDHGRPAMENSTVSDSKSPPSPARTDDSQQSSKIKILFDDNFPGVVFVESNGEKIRIDTSSRSFKNVADVNTDENDDTSAKNVTTAPAQIDESPYDFDTGEEPFDYRIVNIPTPKTVPKGTWNLAFTHRFSQQIHPISSSARDLFGLDSFGIASFGISYGITDKLYVSAYRSPLCRKGVCRTIELGVGYNWLAQNKNSPIGVSTYASIEGNDNFTEEFTYNLQTMISGRLGKRLYLFFSPAVHFNSNGQRRFNPRPTDFFPPATVASTFTLPTHTASFGLGASVMITPNVVALFDFVPRTGFKMGQVRPIFGPNFNVTGFVSESHPSMGIGIQRNVGLHSFALTFSNTQTTTTSRYNSSNLVLSPKRLIIGFNLSRRF